MGINWLTPLYILGLYGLSRFFTGGLTKKTENIAWTPVEAITVTICIYFAGLLVGGLAIYGVLHSLGWSQTRIDSWTSDTVGQFILTAVVYSASIGFLLKFLSLRKSGLKTIGLKGKPKLSEFGRALLTYGVYFLSYGVLLYLAKLAVPSLDLNQKQEIGFNNVSNLQLPLVFVSLVILPPLAEEIVMRGFLYTGLKAKLPKYAAAIITSALFAAAHLQVGSAAPLLWVAAIDTFVLSLFLIHLRDKTGRLWAPIMLHAIKNFVAFYFLFVK